MDWETGIEFGRAIERLSNHERQLVSHDSRLSAVEETQDVLFREIRRAKLFAARAGLVAMLWGAGILMNLPAESIGEILASFLKALLK